MTGADRDVLVTTAPSSTPLSGKMISGGFWTLGLRTIQQALSTVKLLILASLLLPQDFGTIGIALLMVMVLEAFSQTGFQQALVHKEERVGEYLDAAWTFLALRGVLIFISVFVTAPYIAAAFGNPEATDVIRVVAFSTLFAGFSNIGVVYFQKELQFRKQFKLDFASTIIDFAVSLIAVLLWQNVWALVAGVVASGLVRMASSYLLHPYRPKFSLDLRKALELSHYGKWVFLSSVVLFIITQGDDIFIGFFLGATALGLYQMAFKLASLPATEVAHVINQVTFPAYAKMCDDIHALRSGFFRVLQLSMFVSFPLAGLLIICAEDFTQVVLGGEWASIVPVVQLLCVFGLARAMGSINDSLFLGVGRPRYATYVALVKLLLFLPLLYPLTAAYGIWGTALATTAPMLVSHGYSTYLVTKALGVGPRRYLIDVLLPLCGLMVMVAASLLVETLALNHLASLAANVLAGGTAYLLFALLLSKLHRGYDALGYATSLVKGIRRSS